MRVGIFVQHSVNFRDESPEKNIQVHLMPFENVYAHTLIRVHFKVRSVRIFETVLSVDGKSLLHFFRGSICGSTLTCVPYRVLPVVLHATGPARAAGAPAFCRANFP